jgi:hypothetical protein
MVIPFAGLQHDLDETAQGMAFRNAQVAQPTRIVYVGAGGPIMVRSFSLLCGALSHLRVQHPELVEGVRIELYGTALGWREGDPRHLADVARVRGVSDLVFEYPKRVSYRRSLELLLECDGAFIFGVDDAGYMPSKLFTYALSGRPLLASLRRDSPAFAKFECMADLGHTIWFTKSGEMDVTDAANELNRFLREVVARRSFDRRAILESCLAPAIAHRHAELFEACL